MVRVPALDFWLAQHLAEDFQEFMSVLMKTNFISVHIAEYIQSLMSRKMMGSQRQQMNHRNSSRACKYDQGAATSNNRRIRPKFENPCLIAADCCSSIIAVVALR
jgi:hypothetical protein